MKNHAVASTNRRQRKDRWQGRAGENQLGSSRHAAHWKGFEPLEDRLLLSADTGGLALGLELDPDGSATSVLVRMQNPGGEASISRQPGSSQAVTASDDGGSGSSLSEDTQPTANLNGFNINIVAGAGLASNSAAMAAFERAAQMWEAYIADPVTINIDADLANLGDPNVIGQTSSVTLVGGYDVIRDAMVADSASETDDGIVAALPTSSQVSFELPGRLQWDGQLGGTKANLKALGFTGLDSQFGAADGEITFNSIFSFDYDSSDGVTPGTMDFQTVAAHEIGHALGFVSAVDIVDYYTSSRRSVDISARTTDMFRFADNVTGADPSNVSEFTSFTRNLTAGVEAVFDQITPWETAPAEVRMSTGVDNGDGRQASHWKDNNLTGNLIGIFDPTLSFGQVFTISNEDLRALDLTGWDIAPQSSSNNDPPVAVDDSAATNEDTVLSVTSPGVLANDSDPNDDAISVVAGVATSALGATVIINADGSYLYDPTAAAGVQALAEGETAVDTFTYTLSDSAGGTAIGTVSVTLTGINDAPVAQDDSGSVKRGSATIDVLANDYDWDSDHSVINIIFSTQPGHGVVTVNADNTVSYVADSSFVDTDSFTYYITDGNLVSNIATVTLVSGKGGGGGGSGGGGGGKGGGKGGNKMTVAFQADSDNRDSQSTDSGGSLASDEGGKPLLKKIMDRIKEEMNSGGVDIISA